MNLNGRIGYTARDSPFIFIYLNENWYNVRTVIKPNTSVLCTYIKLIKNSNLHSSQFDPFSQCGRNSKNFAAIEKKSELNLNSKMNSPVVFLSLLLATACLSAPADGTSIMDLLLRARQDRLSTLVQALQASGLADTLQKGKYRLFQHRSRLKVDSQ